MFMQKHTHPVSWTAKVRLTISLKNLLCQLFKKKAKFAALNDLHSDVCHCYKRIFCCVHIYNSYNSFKIKLKFTAAVTSNSLEKLLLENNHYGSLGHMIKISYQPSALARDSQAHLFTEQIHNPCHHHHNHTTEP